MPSGLSSWDAGRAEGGMGTDRRYGEVRVRSSVISTKLSVVVQVLRVSTDATDTSGG